MLKLNPASWAVMRGKQTVRLIQMRGEEPAKREREKGTLPPDSDPELFEMLRQLRREHATRLNVPPYVIFADTVLAELARCRPTTPGRMRMVSGIGEVKLRDFGESFLNAIRSHSEARALATDLPPPREATASAAQPAGKISAAKQLSFTLFGEGNTLEEVIHQTKLSRSTLSDYLADFIRIEKPKSIDAWVPEDVRKRVTAAAEEFGTARLKPVYIALNEQVGYDQIRMVFAFLDAGRE